VDRNSDEMGRAMLDSVLREFSIRIERRSRQILFGKGKHKAGLNFGDCFSYALARAYREPLLFKGGDFGYAAS
jgi:uncharacterized protein with PIN domain